MWNSGRSAVLSATNLMNFLVDSFQLLVFQRLELVKVWSLRKRFKLLGCFVDRSADLELPNCQARLRVKRSGMTKFLVTGAFKLRCPQDMVLAYHVDKGQHMSADAIF